MILTSNTLRAIRVILLPVVKLKNDLPPFSGQTQADMIRVSFFGIEKLDASGYITKDTLVNGKPYLSAVRIKPDEEDLKDQKLTMLINKKELNIERITYFVRLADQYQYNEWNIKNIKFDKVTDKTLKNDLYSWTTKHPLKDYVARKDKNIGSLKEGIPAPEFDALLYNGIPLDKEMYKGKILLLDFYYMSCYPCQLAAPKLSAIQQKYKDNIVVIGLNTVDEFKKAAQKQDAYIKRAGITYIIASAGDSVAKAYQVTSYPTLYIIDRHGAVRYADLGFNDDFEKNISTIIDKLIKE